MASNQGTGEAPIAPRSEPIRGEVAALLARCPSDGSSAGRSFLRESHALREVQDARIDAGAAQAVLPLDLAAGVRGDERAGAGAAEGGELAVEDVGRAQDADVARLLWPFDVGRGR